MHSSVRRGGVGFNTQPPEGGWAAFKISIRRCFVSTHSRLKAAGYRKIKRHYACFRFNTQPPEGGWVT